MEGIGGKIIEGRIILRDREAEPRNTRTTRRGSVDTHIKFDINGLVTYEVQLMEPAVEFVQKLAVKMRAKVFRTVGLLERFGPQLSAPHAKMLKGCGGLKELRVKLGNNIVRLFTFITRAGCMW